MSYFMKEQNWNSVINNGDLLERITKKENRNGNISFEDVVNKGKIDNGKLRKKLVSKHVSFSPNNEFIEPSRKIKLEYTPINLNDRVPTPYYNKSIKRKKKKSKGVKNNKRNTSRKIKK